MAQESGELMDIGTVAAHNIANVLGLGEDKVAEIRQAIRDEISAMSSHFSLAVADVQSSYEVELNRIKTQAAADVAAIKADYSFLREHAVFTGVVLAVVFGLGTFLGHVL